MVSGFLTSPWLHWRIESAVARPMRSSSKKLTSNTSCFLLSYAAKGCVQEWLALRQGRAAPGAHRFRQTQLARSRFVGALGAARPRSRLHLFDAGRLAPAQVDAELLRRA